jgi:hypothetical protein
MHSWIFRHRRRLEALYGLPAGRPEPARLGAGTPAPRADEAPDGPSPRASRRLPLRILVPVPRRVA